MIMLGLLLALGIGCGGDSGEPRQRPSEPASGSEAAGSAATAPAGPAVSEGEVEGVAAARAAIASDDIDRRWEGVMALRRLEAAGVPALVEALESPHEDVRAAAAVALGEIAAAPEQAVPALIDRLLDENGAVREQAVRALGAFGTRAADALPRLERMLENDEPHVREAIREVLSRIRGE
jgi:HEAT repeat protein